MANVSTDLIYEVLKAIQARLDRMDLTMGEMKGELQAIRHHQLATSQEVGNIYVKLGRNDDQLNRIETRLGLIDPAH